MARFLMPSLGADMKAGELITWLKQPGDAVQKGEVIAEVETDKAIVEVESLYSGTIESLAVEPGAKVPVGTVLAIIASDEPEQALSAPAAPAPMSRPYTLGRGGSAAGRLRVSPVAQKLAEQLGIDVAGLTGSGPGGRVMERDVREAAARATQPTAAAPTAADRAARMRQGIAAAMSRSHREIPHFHVQSLVYMGRAMDWLAEENSRRSVAQRLIYGVLLVKAAAVALRKVPELNGFWVDERVQLSEAIHAGVAISLPGGGLVAPAIHDADKLSLTDLMAQFRDLVGRARSGRLRASEMTDPTITVTSLGETGAESVLGLIYPPQIALVGFGRLTERPWMVDGQVQARKVIHASLAGDHRAVDGYRASVYLAEVERLLQEPDKL